MKTQISDDHDAFLNVITQAIHYSQIHKCCSLIASERKVLTHILNLLFYDISIGTVPRQKKTFVKELGKIIDTEDRNVIVIGDINIDILDEVVSAEYLSKLITLCWL